MIERDDMDVKKRAEEGVKSYEALRDAMQHIVEMDDNTHPEQVAAALDQLLEAHDEHRKGLVAMKHITQDHFGRVPR